MKGTMSEAAINLLVSAFHQAPEWVG